MLGWFRSLGRPRPGDGVKVTDGPYAGQTGVIQTADDGRFGVYIDECCQPVLAAGQFKRVRRRNVGEAARKAKLGDMDAAIRLTEIDSRDLGDGP